MHLVGPFKQLVTMHGTHNVKLSNTVFLEYTKNCHNPFFVYFFVTKLTLGDIMFIASNLG